jgi:hypothetical protein
MTIIERIIERDDPRIARRAISLLRLDLAAEWPRLTDAQRDWLVDTGIVGTVRADVECTHAAPWTEYWAGQIARPQYTLRITAPGMSPIRVGGWHRCGLNNAGHWRIHTYDGPWSGLPRVDGWAVVAGAGCHSGGLIPCWRQGDQWVTIDRANLERALKEAADAVDHGPAPTWQDARDAGMRCADSRWIIRDFAVAEIAILHGGIVSCDGTYWAASWAVEGRPATYPSLDDAVAAVAALADNGESYQTEQEAIRALGRMVEDAHGSPPGLTVGHDDDRC